MSGARAAHGTTVLAVALASLVSLSACGSGDVTISSKIVAPASATVGSGAPAQAGGSVSRALPVLPEVMDAAAFSSWMATPGIVVIDVRSPAEFAAGHLVGAKNIDLQSSGFVAAVGALSRSGAYLLYCQSGNRSGQALAVMKDAGFVSVGHLAGGIGAWRASGGRVVQG